LGRLLLVPAGASWTSPARDALAAAGFDVATAASIEAAAGMIDDDVLAVAVDAASTAHDDPCARLRCDERTENLPVVLVVRDPLRDDLEELLRPGFDDYVAAGSVGQLRDRAKALAAGDPWGSVRTPSGRVVLAHPDRDERLRIARAIRRGGFDVAFAADGEELSAQIARGKTPRAVVLAADLPPNGFRGAFEQIRADRNGASLPCVVLAGLDELGAVLEPVRALQPARVHDRAGPPENLIFTLNDLLQARAIEARRSPRLLWGAPVAFWTDAAPETAWAWSYNVNRTGLYVRTLVPPPPGTALRLWFRPPAGGGLAAVEGVVRWRKEAGSAAGPASPPGFGIQFLRFPVADEAAFEAGYAVLLAEAERDGTAGTPNAPPGG
jgi:CheY-like chemotaxis protein